MAAVVIDSVNTFYGQDFSVQPGRGGSLVRWLQDLTLLFADDAGLEDTKSH